MSTAQHLDGAGRLPGDPQRRIAGAVDHSAGGHALNGPHMSVAPGTLSVVPSLTRSTKPVPNDGPAPIDWSGPEALLSIFSDALDDLEAMRIATDNRIRSLVEVKGLAGTPEEMRLHALAENIATLEHGATLDLKRALRAHPLGAWVKSTTGIGEKQGGRLIAAIGNPYMRPTLYRDGELVSPAQPRTVSQLWAYCGYHVLPASQAHVATQDANAGGDHSRDPAIEVANTHSSLAGVAPSRKKGQRANWNGTAKVRAFLVAESCIKNRNSPYRSVYEEARAHHAEATHAAECRRCGPSGRPAPIDSPLSDGHKHARAMRKVAKEILKDLWREAKRLQT